MDIVFTCEGVRRKLYISVSKRNKIFRTRCYTSARLLVVGGAREVWIGWKEGMGGGRAPRSPRVQQRTKPKSKKKKTWTVRKGIFIIIYIFPSVFKTPRPMIIHSNVLTRQLYVRRLYLQHFSSFYEGNKQCLECIK